MTWYGPQDLPESLANMTMMPANPESLGKVGDIKLVISAIPPWVDTKVDTIFPESGIPVLSESPLYRFEPDVPLVVPEINADHLSILEDQKKKRGWKSFIVSNPVCTVTIIVMSMKPIIDAFGINMCFQVTLQSMSGAGPKGLAAMDMVENMIPFIGKEEEKGNLLTRAAYQAMKNTKDFNFIGNVEGNDFFTDNGIDVIVCDGFVGNVLVKKLEAFYALLKRRNIKDDFAEQFNFENGLDGDE